MQKLFLVLLLAAILVTSTIASQEVLAKSKNHKAVDKFLRENTLGGDKLSDLCKVTIDTITETNITLVLNNAKCLVVPPLINDTQPPVINDTQPPIINDTIPPVTTCGDPNEVWNGNECVCKTGYHQDNTESCVPDVVVPPIINDTQPPVINQTNGTIKVIAVGDIADSTAGNAVYNAIKNQNADYVFVLGDLGYQSNLNWFKSTYGTSEKVYCVVGNHEASNEDGTASIEAETKQFCGNSYWIKSNATLFVVLNTNDDNLNTLATQTATKVFQNSTVMEGIKTVHILSHKPCAVPPNSHHPLEIKSLCDSIKSNIPSGIQVFYTQAHNHIMSESADGTYKQIGAGGKSHYECGTSVAFPFCDNTHYGYLQYTIKPDGTTTSQFIGSNGVVVK